MAIATAEITYLDAIRAALGDALGDDDRVLLLGEDIGHFGGAFGVTKGLLELFGAERVVDTPISEEGFVGAAFGLAWMGERPVVELQFADFATCPLDQILTVGAKTHWRQGIALPVVIRLPFGGGIRGGPFHAGCPEGLFCGTAGLKVVCPATVADAYGLLRAAVEDDDPVLYLEHKALYRRVRGAAPSPTTRTPIGAARIARPGRDVTVVAYGAMVGVAEAAAEGAAGDVEVLDLRTLWPLDAAAIVASVERTGRLLVVQEASRATGVADAVVALAAEHAFGALDAPPRVIAAPDCPVPFAAELEDAYIPDVARVRAAIDDLLAF